MSNLNESEQSFVRLISNKLLKRPPNFVEKHYLLATLLVVDRLSITKYLCYQYGVTQKTSP